MKAAALLVLIVGGCSDCYLEIVDGSDDNRRALLHPGDRVSFQASIDDHTLTCGGIWLVNDLVGGSAELGTIDTCGHLVMPPAFLPGLAEITIEAIFPGRDDLGSGCESAVRTFTPLP